MNSVNLFWLPCLYQIYCDVTVIHFAVSKYLCVTLSIFDLSSRVRKLKKTEMNRDLSEKDRRKKNNLLAQYYGTNEENVENPLDLDGKHFQAEVFVDKLVKVE